MSDTSEKPLNIKKRHSRVPSIILDPASGKQLMAHYIEDTHSNNMTDTQDSDMESFGSIAEPLLHQIITIQASLGHASPSSIDVSLSDIFTKLGSISTKIISDVENDLKQQILDIYLEVKTRNDRQLKWILAAKDEGIKEGLNNGSSGNVINQHWLPINMELPKFDGSNNDLPTHLDKLKIYFKLHKIEDDEQQKSILLSSLANNVYKSLHRILAPNTLQLASISEITTGLKELYTLEEPIHLKSLRFQMMMQGHGQSVLEYITILKEKAYACNYADTDRRIVEQVLKGIRDDKLRERLLEVKDIKLADVISISTAYEAVKKSATSLSILTASTSQNSNNYESTLRMHSYKRNFRPPTSESSSSKQRPLLDKKHHSTTSNGSLKCYRCGEQGHSKNRCKFSYHVKCATCNRKGHVATICYKKKEILSKRNAAGFEKQETHNLTHAITATSPASNNIGDSINKETEGKIESDSDSDAISLHAPEFSLPFYMLSSSSAVPPIIVPLEVNGRLFKFELDSGSSKSLISERDYYKSFSSIPIEQANISMQTWDKSNIAAVGLIIVSVRHNKQMEKLPLLILKGSGPPLLGRDWMNILNIKFSMSYHTLNNHSTSTETVNLPENLKPYAEVFSSSPGTYSGSPLSIKLKENAVPVAQKHRPVPLAQRELVEKQIENYVKSGIYVPVSSSEWQSPTVNVIKKDGSVRICADYSGTINKYCVPDHFPLPTYDEIFTKLAGKKYYVKMDFTNAYNQLPIDLTTSMLLTLSTHRGLFRPTRLPQGLAVATSLFQREIDTIFAPIRDRAIFYLDDMFGGENSLEELYDLLDKFLNICLQKGLRLNWTKCKIGVTELEAIGYKLSKTGIQPTKDKIIPLLTVPAPKDTKEVQILVGFITYYERFLFNKATILAPLYDLLKSGSKFSWNPEHQLALDTVKKVMSSKIVLAPFLSHRVTTIATDASAIALGVVLSQEDQDGERPVAYSSRVLSKSEKNYSMFELEALAIIYGIKKFHFYLAGRFFTIYCDNKPVVNIFKRGKPLNQITSPRLLRWSLALQDYNYQIIHRPGLKNANADLFSRLCSGNTNLSSVCDEPTTLFHFQFEKSSLSPSIIKDSTQQDIKLELLRNHIINARSTNELPPSLSEYKHSMDGRISTLNGVLLYADRIIIPEKLIPTVLSLLHKVHFGISKTKAYARSYFYWPAMDRHIEEYINNCQICCSMANALKFPSSYKWPPATEPWQRLHLDFLGPFLGTTMLLLIDAFSGWIELFNTKNSQTSATVIDKLDQLWVDRGIPEICISDNGPCFSSEEFKAFLKSLNIKHITTSPYTPQANGLAERAVQTVKHLLKKQPTDIPLNHSIREVLSVLRNTPNESGQSPAELLNGRKLKNELSKLHPRFLKHTKNSEEVQPTEKIPTFELHDRVNYRIHNKSIKWSPGIISGILGNKMYEISGGEEKVKRHVSQIKKRYYSSNIDNDTAQTTVQPSPLTTKKTHKSRNRERDIGI